MMDFDTSFWIHIATRAALVLAGLTLLAYLIPGIHRFLDSIYDLFHRPFQQLQAKAVQLLKRIREWAKEQILHEAQGNTVLRILGALLGAAFFLLCSFCDLGILALSLEALGFGHLEMFLALEPIWAIAGMLLLSAAVWGLLFFELIRVTDFWPWVDKLVTPWRGRMLKTCGAMFILIGIIVVGQGLWRAGVASENSQALAEQAAALTNDQALSLGLDVHAPQKKAQSQPRQHVAAQHDIGDTIEVVVLAITMAGTSLVSLMSTAVSFKMFIVTLKYLAMMAAYLGSMVLSLFLTMVWLLLKTLRGMFNIIKAFLNLLTMPGMAVLRVFGWVRRKFTKQTVQQA